EDGIRDFHVTGVQTCALPIYTVTKYVIRLIFLAFYFILVRGGLIYRFCIKCLVFLISLLYLCRPYCSDYRRIEHLLIILFKQKQVNTLSYKTVSANKNTVNKEWIVVDAEGEILGRLASQIAKVIRGKHKPEFTPHVDCGDNV